MKTPTDNLLEELTIANPMLAIQASLKLINNQLKKAEISRKDFDDLSKLASRFNSKIKEVMKASVNGFIIHK